MPSLWTIDAEAPSGDTTSTTQTLNPVNWTSATITLRRRAPHEYAIQVPRHSHHRLTDFVAGRELRIARNGAYTAWGAGFLDAPSLPGGSRGEQLEVRGWGAAYILTTRRAWNMQSPFGGLFGFGTDVDSVIGQMLDTRHAADDSAGTNWFTAGGRTIGASATSMVGYASIGKSPLEVINDACDVEGWSWRAGINTAGTLTFVATATADTDRSATIHCYDGANCRIIDFDQDGSRITTSVVVAARYPSITTHLNGAHGGGATSLTVDDSTGFEAGDVVLIGEEGGTQETKTISSVGSTTSITLTAGLTNAQADNASLKPVPGRFRATNAVNAAAAQRQAHHYQTAGVFNDAMLVASVRDAYATAYLNAYDAPLKTAMIEVTDTTLIDRMLDNALHPGDSIALTSGDQDLSLVYSGTTVRVQEMTLEIEPGGARSLRLAVGDPIIDALGVMERKLAAAQAAATRYGRGSY